MMRRNFFMNSIIWTLCLLLLPAIAARADMSFSELAKLYPVSLSVEASSAFSQKAKDDRESAWRLFDRDTGTVYAPGKPASVKLTLPSVQDIRLLRFYGQGSYIINIYRPNGGDWKRIPSLSGIDAAALAPSWNSLEPGESLREEVLLLEFVPKGNRRIGIGEIELWGTSTGCAATATLAGLKGAAEAENLLSKNPPHILSIAAAPSEITLSPDAGVSGDASIQLDHAPSIFKRAYLLFDGYGIPRSAFLRKGINGTAWTGGASIPVSESEKTSWSSDLEEINPAWLTLGNNRIYLEPSIPSAVRGLKLLVETDSGWNNVSGAAPAELYDGDTSTFAKIALEGDAMTLEFERKVQPLSLLLHVPYSQGGKTSVLFRTGGSWNDAGAEIDFSALSPGWNEIRLPSCGSADALRLTVAGLTRGDNPIVLDEVRVAASPVGSPTEQASLVITYPRDGEYFGRTAFVQGFVSAHPDLLGKLLVSAEGKKADTDNSSGSFGVTLTKDETSFASQADDEPWSALISADMAGISLAKTIPFDLNSGAASDTDGTDEDTSDQGKSVSEKVVPGQAKKIRLGRAGLDIPKDGVSNETDISITALSAEQLAALDTGLTNVTSPDTGYRFLPHGSRFKKKLTVTLPYDAAMIPPGMTEQDITTYYFDETAGAWKALEKVRVDTAQKVVESLTDHFTDMINATLTVPDHPQTASFNPTSIKDIKAADPGAGVNLIDPPKANNMGDARVSYPIEIPPGRNGMQPQIAVQYNSSGGNGWMGMGWDVPMQSITIDTRWGVPRYDSVYDDSPESNLETETYLLDGEQLTPVAHRGELQPRTADKVFHTRVEGQFRRIIRHGDRPDNYWWEVTDKNGVRFIYGGDPDGGRMDAEAVLADPQKGNIFKWALREVRDTNGNTIRYSFARAADGGTAEGSQFYLNEIRYTGRPGAPGLYSVTFVRDRELHEARRPDVGVDARAGFRVVSADLLRKIEVRLGGEMIRSYDFAYREGAFKKTLLKSVSQYNGRTEPELFNTHEFDYYDDIRDENGKYNGFKSPVTWNTGGDGVAAGILDTFGIGGTSALSGSSGLNGGGHLYVGFNPLKGSKILSVGLKVGFNYSENEGLLALIDINGDGLPDKVFKKGSGYSYRANRTLPGNEPKFEDPSPLNGLPGISAESAMSFTFGDEAYPYEYVNILHDSSETFSDSDTYFTDVNGDGLPDLVTDGTVFFNYIKDGAPAFTEDSSLTPVPIGLGKVDTNGLLKDFSAIDDQMVKHSPLMDAVRRWIAPYDGQISIDGDVSLMEDNSQARQKYKTADGVRAVIQHNDSELWSTTIEATDYTSHRPNGLGNIVVKSGDVLFFRVQSRFDGSYDQVSWDPKISYENVPKGISDVNNLNPYEYKASSDFVLAGRGSRVQMPYTGSISITGDLYKKGITTDDIELVVYKNGNAVISKAMAWDASGAIVLNEELDVTKDDTLAFRIRSDSVIDLQQMEWAPQLYYTAVSGDTPVKDGNGNYQIKINPPYDADLYPVYLPDAPAAPQEPWTAASAGTVSITPALTFSSAVTTEVVFTVKKKGALLAKELITVDNGVMSNPAAISLTVAKGEELFFDFSSRNTELKTALASVSVKVASDGGTSVQAPCAFHAAAKEDAFPVPYRGWGVIAYNGNYERATRPIDGSLLFIDQNYKLETAYVYPLSPLPADRKWGGFADRCWLAADSVSSSRLGLPYPRAPRSSDFADASSVSRIGRSSQDAVGVGPGSIADGNSTGELDFMDMNGDSFPDVVGNGRIQYTKMTGGLEGQNRPVTEMDNIRSSSNEARNLSATGTTPKTTANARGMSSPTCYNGPVSADAHTAEQRTEMPALSIGGSIGDGSSDAESDLMDINGDGLPDRVFADGTVALNLGYSFAPRQHWNSSALNTGESINGGINLGYSSQAYGWAGGLSFSTNESQTKGSFLDVNGDGLPDRVFLDGSNNLQVAINTGSAFAPPVPWGGAGGRLATDKNYSLGGGVYFTIPLGPFCYAGCYVIINPGISFGTTMGTQETAIRDVDGDGNPDYVDSDDDGAMSVRDNATGRTNLLKNIKRPLGATMDLEYVRSGNTYEQPQSRWVLSKTIVHDGFSGDGVDKLITTCRYEGGRYDRLERDFYGYRTVTEESRDAGNNEALYRKTVQTYKTDSYYTKGLLERAIMKDESDRPYTDTVNTYRLVDAFSSFDTVDPLSTTATVFPQLNRTEQLFYEGKQAPGKYTYTDFGYDGYGNVSRFFDAGDVGAGDDVEAEITYTNYTGPYIVGKPERMTVSSNGKELRRREGGYDSATGNLREVRQYLESGKAAVTNLTYFEDGNLETVTGPENLKGERYQLTYGYDPLVNTFVTDIKDSFGYKSFATYNYKYGKVETTTDTNNNQTITKYDDFGRTEKVFGPYEAGTGIADITFEYHPEAQVPWALTRHYDPYRSPADTIDTVLFTDGLKRVIQTKKDATLHTGADSGAMDGMTVSGRVIFDGMGRTVLQYYPVTEGLGQPGAFNPAFDNIPPTRFTYDVLDRTLKTTLPDGTFTTVAYGFGPDRRGALQFETVVTDANDIAKMTFKDVQEQITSIRETNKGGAEVIWTSYDYDPLNQIVEVIDDKNNRTTVSYDNLGRRTVIDNPDTGKTEIRYDPAGNVTAKITATLAKTGKQISYDYDFNRLKTISYPDFPGNNVAYTYGEPGAKPNRAGRIVTVSDQSGKDERFYGKLGELTKEIKTVASKTQGKSANSPEVYTTEYTFDTFGRLQRLVYPDGETLTNLYDAGGLLRAATGIRGSFRYDYLKRLEYDKFEQRAFVQYGNNVRSSYTYDPYNRRLANLRAGKSTGNLFQNILYGYDKVGNILSLKNDVAIPSPNEYGGPTDQGFRYDDLYRLTDAQGIYQFASGKQDIYSFAMSYDTIHNILNKNQEHQVVQPSGTLVTQKKTTYNWNYAYNNQKPHAPVHIGERTYSYDDNGNQTGWTSDANGTRRNIVWDEENRIQSVFDNGHQKEYIYNDAGDRVIKRGPQGETVYVNQFFVVRNRTIATKHIFAGNSRIATRMMPGTNGTTNLGSTTTATIFPGQGLYHRSAQGLLNGKNTVNNPHYSGVVTTTGNGAPGNTDNFLYFYHPDHLGSTSFVTDVNGKLYEHIEYFPFGETWVEEHSNTQRTPYLFTGKELDEETGLYYFGARYYDPRTSVWLSADPILGRYLDGKPNSGVYNPINLAQYTYAEYNPVKLVDPDGHAPTPFERCMAYLKGAATGAIVGLAKSDAILPALLVIATTPEGADFKNIGEAVYPDDTELANDFQNAFNFTGEHTQDIIAVTATIKSGKPQRVKTYQTYTNTNQTSGGKTRLLDEKELAKKLNMSVSEFHDVKGQGMKKDFAKEMKKLGTTNPDIKLDAKDNIVLQHPKTKQEMPTGVPLDSYAK